MKALILVPCLLMAACGGSAADRQNPHDTKYTSVTVGDDTCVSDKQTGLTWAIKTTQPGLHHRDNTYSWWHPGESVGELDYRGVEDAGQCAGSGCDTWNYVQAVNQSGYCGHSDWRMPGKDELFSISDLLRADDPPTINTEYFPYTHSAEYWSGNDYSFQYDAAWGWNFELGHDRVDWKKTPKYIRLVRGTPGELQAVKE